jgi:DNA-binding LytR/AlgR family response regulator
MRVLIVEDERSATDFLVRLVKRYDESIEIVQTLPSISLAVEWFGSNQQPDLAFMDIQLADGLSFDIFEQVQVTCPVIFTTAYQEYAIRAFRVNSIDYLLKPIDPEHLARAIEKYKHITLDTGTPHPDFTSRVLKVMDMITPKGKSRFLVKIGVHLRSVSTADISCFQSMERSTFLVDRNGKCFDMDASLDQLQEQVNPTAFFRINRNYLVNRDFITDVIIFSGSRFKLKVAGLVSDDLLVSRKRAADFRAWLEGDPLL